MWNSPGLPRENSTPLDDEVLGLTEDFVTRSDADPDYLGVDWGDVGKQAFGGGVTGANILLTAYGMGGVAKGLQPLEQQSGLLPEWAGGQPGLPSGGVKIIGPKVVAVARTGAPLGSMPPDQDPTVQQANVYGGKRIPAAGVQSGDPLGMQSFAYDNPTKVELVSQSGLRATLTDVQRIVFVDVASEDGKSPGAVAATQGQTSGPKPLPKEFLKSAAYQQAQLKLKGALAQQAAAQSRSTVMGKWTTVLGDWLHDAFGIGHGDPINLAQYKSTYKTSDAYKAAQDALAAAQAHATAAQSVHSSYVKPSVIPVSVPSFYSANSQTQGSNTDMATSDDNVTGDLDITMLGDDIGYEATQRGPADGCAGDLDMTMLGEQVASDLGEPIVSFRATPQSQEQNYYIIGSDILGASVKPAAKPAGPRKGPPGNKSPLGRINVPTAKPTGKKSPHAVGMKNAKVVAANAIAAGTHAKARAAQYVPSAHKTIIPLAPVKVNGTTVLGTSAALTPVQQAAVQKHTNAIAKHKAAVDHAKKAAAKAIQAGKDLDKLRAKVKPAMQRLNPKVVIAGDWTEIVGDDGWTDIIGDVVAEVLGVDPSAVLTTPGAAAAATTNNPPDPSNPGYLMDGTPDPNAPAASAATSVDTSQPFTPPTRDQTLSASDAQTKWNDVPPDGVVYDFSKGDPRPGAAPLAPDHSFGSAATLYGLMPDTHHVYWIDGGRWRYYNGDDSDDALEAAKAGEAGLQALNLVSMRRTDNKSKVPWGPLVGAPSTPFAGLQLAQNTGQFFWQSDNAPSWATQEQDNALRDLYNKTQAAQAAADAATAAQQAQEQAQQQEAQAAQDAANALAQSAADTQSNIAQQQQAAQQAAQDLVQQKSDQAQAAAEAAAELEDTKRQAALEAKAQEADLDYAIAHPEVAMQQADQGADQGGDTGDGVTSPEEESQDMATASELDAEGGSIQADMNAADAQAFDEEG